MASEINSSSVDQRGRRYAQKRTKIRRLWGDDSKDRHSRKECGTRLELPWNERIPKSSLLAQSGDVLGRCTPEKTAVFAAELRRA